MRLAELKCAPVASGTAPLSIGEALELIKQVPEWRLADNGIERGLKFKDFRAAMGFVNKVADLAESEGHHPDISISYNKVRLRLSIHKIGGLSHNDFILAAKVEGLTGMM